MNQSPPTTINELLTRAQHIAGYTLSELAAQSGIPVPENLKRDKGWVGQLLEMHLGASAGSKPLPDFIDLGIELKTIPISHVGKPLETTFVSVAPLTGIHNLRWEESHVRHKLAHVLWIPVEGEREIPVGDRHVGYPVLWRPSLIEESQLQQDWEELMDLIVLGKVESITARHGEVLQLRPKAANSKALTEAYGENGQPIKTLPRGFYLKTHFTHKILTSFFD
ncbi:DNA mismatch repair endonuclease MutH [Aliivibrio wodanis]|uniref:DNA mismatch repair protein MutH n=1 Tax=Aliivibrio wodanis TaxID=80852 RepID=A0A090IVA1_9GAMM|nr:DNA mismatch repair protein MutH [Aliivibrio wodanis]VVV05025.1 DNA mismatch repair protein MutH [Aliivibrio wodanis]